MTATQTKERGRLIETFAFRVPTAWRVAAAELAEQIDDDLSEAYRLIYAAGLRALRNSNEPEEAIEDERT